MSKHMTPALAARDASFYTITEESTTNGAYKVCNGTYYSTETPDSMVRLLELIRKRGIRVRFHWGDAQTGEDWGDHYDVIGKIGRSMGPVRIPILIHNARSMGGGAILTYCIVKITYANKRDGGVLYEHPAYHVKPDAHVVAQAA